jgi:hypothetical protein
MRAAARADPISPTGAAVGDWNETLGLTKKSIDVDNIIAQSNQEAGMRPICARLPRPRSSADASAPARVSPVASAKGLSGLGGGGSSMPKGYNPNSLSGLY